MPLFVVRNDITKMAVDAIVNTASSRPVHGSGTDAAVYQAAGQEQLTRARQAVGVIEPGTAAMTPAFDLEENGVRYIFHAVHWNYRTGSAAERATLRGAYTQSLELAAENGCRSIAIPLLGAGNRGWPIDIAIDEALASIHAFLHRCEMDVYLVLFSPLAMNQARRLFPDIPAYVDEDYVREKTEEEIDPLFRWLRSMAPRPAGEDKKVSRSDEMPGPFPPSESVGKAEAPKLEDDSLIRMLDRVMEEKQIKPGDVYNKTSITRQVLSKVRSNADYHLGKSKVLELTFVLRLTLPEAEFFLSLADYAFNPSSRRDKIVRKCLTDGVYDLFVVDELLYNAGETPIYSLE